MQNFLPGIQCTEQDQMDTILTLINESTENLSRKRWTLSVVLNFVWENFVQLIFKKIQDCIT